VLQSKRSSHVPDNRREQRGTCKLMILVPLSILRFLNERAANAAGTSNRRHWPALSGPYRLNGTLENDHGGVVPCCRAC
jgi:hypothetical protein